MWFFKTDQNDQDKCLTYLTNPNITYDSRQVHLKNIGPNKVSAFTWRRIAEADYEFVNYALKDEQILENIGKNTLVGLANYKQELGQTIKQNNSFTKLPEEVQKAIDVTLAHYNWQREAKLSDEALQKFN
jgi:hypothetical protein